MRTAPRRWRSEDVGVETGAWSSSLQSAVSFASTRRAALTAAPWRWLPSLHPPTCRRAQLKEIVIQNAKLEVGDFFRLEGSRSDRNPNVTLADGTKLSVDLLAIGATVAGMGEGGLSGESSVAAGVEFVV